MSAAPSALPRALFITGTDTDCGKTLIASAVIYAYRRLGLRVVGMKPVASGSVKHNGVLINHDVESLTRASNVDLPADIVNPYIFEPAISPHFAAAEMGVRIEKERILSAFKVCQEAADIVIVEGAGGWRVPLGDGLDIASLAKTMDLPVLMVTGLRLGCINHTLLTFDDIQAKGCQVAGWVANLVDKNYGFINETIASIQSEAPAALLASVPWLEEPDAEKLAAAIDLTQLASI